MTRGYLAFFLVLAIIIFGGSLALPLASPSGWLIPLALAGVLYALWLVFVSLRDAGVLRR